METKSLVSFGSDYPKERGGVCGRTLVERPPVSKRSFKSGGACASVLLGRTVVEGMEKFGGVGGFFIAEDISIYKSIDLETGMNSFELEGRLHNKNIKGQCRRGCWALSLYQMKIKALHEIYVSFKLFETIAFHNQGLYDISAELIATNHALTLHALPLSLDHRKLVMLETGEDSTLYREGRVDPKSHQYYSTVFDVNFNEQTFPFQGSCKFKLEIDAELEDSFELNLILKIHKYGQSPSTLNTKNNMGTDRSECPIIDDSASKKTSKQINPSEVVSELKIRINKDKVECHSPYMCYQKVVFTTHQYFSSLLLTVNHCRKGYKIRPNSTSISQFDPKQSQGQSRGSNKTRAAQVTEEGLFALVSQTFGSVKNAYNKLVRNSIEEYNRLATCEDHLKSIVERSVSMGSNLRSLSKQSVTESTASFNLTSRKNSNSRLLEDLSLYPRAEICNPGTFPHESLQEDLIEHYDCKDRKELLLVLFDENMNIQKAMDGRWANCLHYYSEHRFSSNYMHRLYLGFKEITEYISEHRYSKSYQEWLHYQRFVPQMKFVNEIYLKIPKLHKLTTPVRRRMELDSVEQQGSLFVLAHGFNGNEHDMNRIKSFIGCFSSPHFLILRSISGRTVETLEELGKIAAEEIKAFLINRYFIKKINFIGFSLGGVIIRACLPFLQDFYPCFNLLITLSSPHLGVNQLNSCVVRTGVAFLHKIRGVKNLKELSIDIKHKDNGRDYEQREPTYLQRLSKDDSLSYFRMVIFCGSEHDKYVPGYSSTLQYTGKNPCLQEMQRGLLEKIVNLHRISVNFDPDNWGNYWDKFSGRRIHINFLDDGPFLHFLFSEYFHLF